MHITLFDSDESWTKLLPLTYTRPAADLRVGILKIHEKWAKHLQCEEVYFRTKDYLRELFSPAPQTTLHIKGNSLPNAQLVNEIQTLKVDEVLVKDREVIAGFFESNEPIVIGTKTPVSCSDLKSIDHTWHIFRFNGEEIRKDYDLITEGRASGGVADSYSIMYNREHIFVEEGAKIRAAVLNAENGPIYIGKNAEVHEGALIKGPHALLNNSVINMGAKIKGDSTIGPYSKVGGEFSNSVLQGYSNKGHEGFLGNSVLGEWCNIGADTNNSNLKNNYADIKMWGYDSGQFMNTGLQFCGLIMADHSKCGINTMFNTGTTIGVSANIFGDGFPKNFIPSFSWGGSAGFTTFQLKKAHETAEIVMKRKNRELTEADKRVMEYIFKSTAHYRVWEKR